MAKKKLAAKDLKSESLAVKLTPAEMAAVKRVTALESENYPTQLARRVIMAYVTRAEQKKRA